LAARAL
jgi:RNA polymerase sigma factor (sigma-70 family)